MKVTAGDNVTVLATYTYGDSNERLITDESGYRTYYAANGGTVIAEYSETPALPTTPKWSKSYVYLGGRLLSTLTPNGSGGEAVQYHHPDRLGTRLVTDPVAGTSFEQVTLPFGTALDAESTDATNRRFTSYDRSGTTGLDYAVNRHYDSQQGRFTQVDPIGMGAASLRNPQSLNLYAYTENDSVNFVDPSGLRWRWSQVCSNIDGDITCAKPEMYWEDDPVLFERVLDHPRGGGGGEGPQDTRTDCQKFADIAEQIANEAANADDFMQRMVNRFIGPNLNATSGEDFEKAGNIGNREFGAGGFREQFKDTSNQVRHFTGGLWAGHLYGPGVGQLGMNSNEDNTVVSGRGVISSFVGILPTFWPTEDSTADIALNSVSVALGVNLTPRNEEIIDRGDRGGWRRIRANAGYKGLAAAIRSQVCE